MIARYTRPEMHQVWAREARFHAMLKVEIAVAQVQAEMGLIPLAAAQDIQQKARVDVATIEKIEMTTRHDVIAFVSQVAESIGPHGRFLHFGLTSSDVLDTALSLQMVEASQVLEPSLQKWENALEALVERYQNSWCAGRTHGMHAEPTTFGWKMAGHLMELRRARVRWSRALQQMKMGKLSGAVGTYSALASEVEARVCERLQLRPEVVSTQVLPRDRHGEVMWALAMIGAALERLSVECRHLQRTEVSEVREGFSQGQKGSSAMPHKKNPIGFENLTGVSRMLRSYLSAALENISLWHERDISHSSVERVFLPDAFCLADYAADRMSCLLVDLEVDTERMKKNMELSQGQLWSSHLLLALVQKGLSREEAYRLVQSLSHGLKPGESLAQCAGDHPQILQLLNKVELNEVFSGHQQTQALGRRINQVLLNKTGGLL